MGDVRFRTADRVEITDGLRVWDYDLRPGTVDVAESEVNRAHWDGWFQVRTGEGRHSLMNGERMVTVHPFTREAPPAEAVTVATGEGWSDAERDRFVGAHVRAALLSVDAEETAGQQTVTTLLTLVDPNTQTQLTSQAYYFAERHAADLGRWLSPERAGRDLWLTRTGEGEGFWARSVAVDPAEMFTAYAVTVAGDAALMAEFDAAMVRLTDAAHGIGVEGLYVGDDGRLYL